MIEFGVAVVTDATYTVKRIDIDFFEAIRSFRPSGSMKRGIPAGSHLQSEGRVELTILSSPAACDHSLVLVFLKTNVPKIA